MGKKNKKKNKKNKQVAFEGGVFVGSSKELDALFGLNHKCDKNQCDHDCCDDKLAAALERDMTMCEHFYKDASAAGLKDGYQACFTDVVNIITSLTDNFCVSEEYYDVLLKALAVKADAFDKTVDICYGATDYLENAKQNGSLFNIFDDDADNFESDYDDYDFEDEDFEDEDFEDEDYEDCDCDCCDCNGTDPVDHTFDRTLWRDNNFDEAVEEAEFKPLNFDTDTFDDFDIDEPESDDAYFVSDDDCWVPDADDNINN